MIYIYGAEKELRKKREREDSMRVKPYETWKKVWSNSRRCKERWRRRRIRENGLHTVNLYGCGRDRRQWIHFFYKARSQELLLLVVMTSYSALLSLAEILPGAYTCVRFQKTHTYTHAHLTETYPFIKKRNLFIEPLSTLVTDLDKEIMPGQRDEGYFLNVKVNICNAKK